MTAQILNTIPVFISWHFNYGTGDLLYLVSYMRSTASLSYGTIMYINTRFRHSCKTIDILIEK